MNSPMENGEKPEQEAAVEEEEEEEEEGEVEEVEREEKDTVTDESEMEDQDEEEERKGKSWAAPKESFMTDAGNLVNTVITTCLCRTLWKRPKK